MLAVLWEDTTLEDIKQLRQEIPEARRIAGDKLIYLSISDVKTPPPGAAERKAMVQLAEDMMEYYEALYIVLRAEGFHGSVLRSVMATMMLFSRHRQHVYVVDSIEEVLYRHSDRLGLDESSVRRQLAKDGILLPRELASEVSGVRGSLRRCPKQPFSS